MKDEGALRAGGWRPAVRPAAEEVDCGVQGLDEVHPSSFILHPSSFPSVHSHSAQSQFGLLYFIRS
jgi:hypothetical protein